MYVLVKVITPILCWNLNFFGF